MQDAETRRGIANKSIDETFEKYRSNSQNHNAPLTP